MNKTLMAWLKCKVSQGKSKLDRMISVTGVGGKKVEHQVPADRVHPKNTAVLVMVFKDKDGYWVRFPSSGPYSPFRVEKDQLRKA